MEEKPLKELFEVLNQEYDCLCTLNQLALDKKDAIIKNDIDELSELLGNVQKTIEQIKSLEKERLIIISQLKVLYGLNKDDLTFAELRPVLPALWQEELTMLREKLMKIIEELHKKNEKNRVLISEALKLNKVFFGLLLNVLEPANQIYDKKKNFGINTSHILDQLG